MTLTQLRLQTFRCYPAFDLSLLPGVTTITGPNGAGKTALLEAIYFVSHLRSFRTSQPRDLAQHGSRSFGIDIRAGERSFRVRWAPEGREQFLDGEPAASSADFWGQLPAVVLSSHDLSLAAGPSAERRQFLNGLLSQIDRTHLRQLLRYRALLKQRNAHLRAARPDRSLLDTMRGQLESIGRPLQTARQDLARRLSRIGSAIHARLAANGERLALDVFPAGWSADIESELKVKQTLFGLHRDRVDLAVRAASAQRFASEGQQRTAAIALRAAGAWMLARRRHDPPVLLIDDVFTDLDQTRRRRLARLIPPGAQVLVATTDDEWLADTVAISSRVRLK